MKKKAIKIDTLYKKLGKFITVLHLPSKNGYGGARNQFELIYSNGRLFKSYDSAVAAYVKGQLYVSEFYHDYSNTTMLYCKRFTGLTVEQRRKGIADGTIKTFER